MSQNRLEMIHTGKFFYSEVFRQVFLTRQDEDMPPLETEMSFCGHYYKVRLRFWCVGIICAPVFIVFSIDWTYLSVGSCFHSAHLMKWRLESSCALSGNKSCFLTTRYLMCSCNDTDTYYHRLLAVKRVQKKDQYICNLGCWNWISTFIKVSNMWSCFACNLF